MLCWLCIVHSLAAYTPGIRAGAILLGLPPQTKQGCLQSATQSHCTMQWHKWLTTCTGASPLRPQFNNYEVYRQTDSVRLLKCVVEFLTYLLCRPSAFSVLAVYHYPAVSVHTARLFTAGHKHAYARTADYLRTPLTQRPEGIRKSDRSFPCDLL